MSTKKNKIIQELNEEIAKLRYTVKVNKYRNSIIHGGVCSYKNKVDYVDRIILTYSVTSMTPDNQLRKFEKEVLNYYMRFGYSTETKKKAQKGLKKNYEAITQATFHLSKKGYLITSKTNLSNKNLNKELIEIKKNLIDGNHKVMAVIFKRK